MIYYLIDEIQKKNQNLKVNVVNGERPSRKLDGKSSPN